jgi:hypothetical protein
MPNIRTYNADVHNLQPSELGPDSFAQAGRRITSIYDDIASAKRQSGDAMGEALGGGIKAAGDAYVAYEDHQQISAGMPAAAGLLLKLQQQANDITKNSDPNNPAVYGKFRDEVLEPALTEFQEGFSTENSQRWAMEQTNGIREHMQHKMIADMSTMASQAVSLNLNKTANTASNAVYQDPSALDFTLDMLKHSTGATVASSPNITPEDASRVNGEVLQKLNEKVVRAAVQGAIEKNPDAGLAMAQDPKYSQYIDGGEASRFAQEVKRQNKADEVNARVLQDRQTRLTSEKTFDDVNVALHSDNPPTLADIRRIPSSQISAEHRNALFNITEKLNNKEELKPAGVYAEGLTTTLEDIWRPQGDPKKITTASELQSRLADGTINYEGYTRAKKELLNPNDDDGVTLQQNRAEAMKLMGPLLNPKDDAGTLHHQGFDRVQNAYISIRRLEQQAREKTGDPTNVYNPKSPYYYRNDPAFQPPSPYSLSQEATANMKAESKPDAVVPPKPAGAPTDATWNPQYKMYTYIRDGKIKGYK